MRTCIYIHVDRRQEGADLMVGEKIVLIYWNERTR